MRCSSQAVRRAAAKRRPVGKSAGGETLRSASAAAGSAYAFRTRLGWMAILGSGQRLSALTFGHDSAEAAVNALDARLVAGARRRRWNDGLVRRLQAYARGVPETFSDVEIDLGECSDFRREVIRACRGIPYGTTVSYGELASRAGFPGAARAVGNCLAGNGIPLVVPCHRVLGADGRLHGYSGLSGPAMKRRLLELERASRREEIN